MASWVKDFVVNTPFGNVLNTELNRRRTAQAQRDQIAGNIAQSVGIKQGQALLETDPNLVQRQINAELMGVQSQIDNAALYKQRAGITGEIEGIKAAASKLAQAESFNDNILTFSKMYENEERSKLLAQINQSGLSNQVYENETKNMLKRNEALYTQQSKQKADLLAMEDKINQARLPFEKANEFRQNMAEYQLYSGKLKGASDALADMEAELLNISSAITKNTPGTVYGTDGAIYEIAPDKGRDYYYKVTNKGLSDEKSVLTDKFQIQQTDPGAYTQLEALDKFAALKGGLEERKNLLNLQYKEALKRMDEYRKIVSEVELKLLQNERYADAKSTMEYILKGGTAIMDEMKNRFGVDLNPKTSPVNTKIVDEVVEKYKNPFLSNPNPSEQEQQEYITRKNILKDKLLESQIDAQIQEQKLKNIPSFKIPRSESVNVGGMTGRSK